MKLLLSFANQQFGVVAIYRLEFFGELLGSLVQLLGVYWLWTTLAVSRPELLGASLDQVLTYAILGLVLSGVMNGANLPRYFIATLMRLGSIQNELVKPLDFHFQVFARACGMGIYHLLADGLVGALIGVLLLGVRGPASPLHAALFVVSVLLAFLVGFGLNFLLGLVSVFSIEISHISWFYYAITGFFSGQYVPLWMFPPLLASIVSFLPFQALIGIPMSIYIGRFTPAQALQAIALQAAWALAFWLLGRLVWRRGYQRLVVQGG